MFSFIFQGHSVSQTDGQTDLLTSDSGDGEGKSATITRRYIMVNDDRHFRFKTNISS